MSDARRQRTLAAAVMAVVLIVVAIVWIVWRVPRVPDYTGMTIQEVEEAAAEIGLELGDVAYDAESDDATWTVIAQDPAAGQPVGAAEEIKITVAGRPPADVPRVVGLKLDDAVLAVEEAGLVLGAVTESDVTTASAGTVIAQAFPAGEPIPAGTVLALVVSSGPEAQPVPDVVAASASDARDQLEQAGFDVETEQREDLSPAGTVLEQDPPPGDEAQPGSTVKIVESKGALSEEFRILGTWTAADNGDSINFRANGTVSIPGDVVLFEISNGVLTIEYADWGPSSYGITWKSVNEFRWEPRSGGDPGGPRLFRRSQ
jgi:serine/threonine-protein kinase